MLWFQENVHKGGISTCVFIYSFWVLKTRQNEKQFQKGLMHTQAYKQKTQNGPSVSQLKISTDWVMTVKSPWHLRKAVLQSWESTTRYQIFYCLKKQLQKAFICSKESVPFDAEQNPKISQLLSVLSKPAYQTRFSLEHYFFHTSNSKFKMQILYIYT